MPECIFCRIARGELESQIVAEDDQVVAFRDTNPQAPTHVLVIPRKHIDALDRISAGDGALMAQLMMMANQVADQENLDSGYRIVINNGTGAGQSVFHLHLHVLGGRTMSWPPG
jgi:histidine triad (HIT) family protein